MARPRKIGLDYFPHDVDVTTDPKIEPAIMRYGAAAYAFYFIHLEYCYRSNDLTVDVSATETGTEMREVIQRKLHIDERQYENILQSFLRHGAFDADFYDKTGKLTSQGIRKRAGKVFEKREREAERYENKVSGTISAAETGAETTQSKAKNSKANKSIEKNSTPKTILPGDGGEELEISIQEKRFQEFWAAYPKKTGKQAALKSWQKIKPTKELHLKIMEAVSTSKQTEQWQRENGRFIPNPTTWLNQGRWDDEVTEIITGTPYQGNFRNEYRMAAGQTRTAGSVAPGFKMAGEPDDESIETKSRRKSLVEQGFKPAGEPDDEHEPVRPVLSGFHMAE